ncbi:MAG: ABC transporter ATP-binding protein [Clostridiales bacterium]|nr:ABC transporter ATP-binding protein [Clostridiales bacterium]
MITVSQLYHSYTRDERYSVRDVSFEIGRGEIFGFLGPSGAGKSTTQNILTGLLVLQKGEVSIDGVPLRNMGSRLFNRMGVCFERANNYRKLTGYENLRFFAQMYSVPTEDPMKLLDSVGLGEAAHRRAGQYSKGMFHRLNFARSMINRPDIWFLDEPTAGLDPATADRIKGIIRARQQAGATVFLTTHDMHIADELCDRVAFIDEGRLVAMDTPRALKLRYGDRNVCVEYVRDGQPGRETLSLSEDKDKVRLREILETATVETMHSQEATLDRIFIELTGKELGS